MIIDTPTIENIPSVATAGTFDGVHRGHRAVLESLTEAARREGLRPLAITFDRHPLETVAPEKAPLLLTSHERQAKLISDCGVELLRIPFDKATAAMTAREWLRQLREKFGVRILVIGYDNTFGHDGLDMSISDYSSMAQEEGITILEAPVVEDTSSSRVRRALLAGEVERARLMLGRPYELEGVVVSGNALGRTLGFPTANIGVHPRRLVPADGTYAVAAILPQDEILPAMVNIGIRPTVDDSGRRSVECNIIDWEGDLYTRPLEVRFLSRIRDEKKFDSIEELKAQLAEDRETAIRTFNDYIGN